MTITKTHDNGGTFVSDLIVQPKFTFTRGMDVRILDTGDPMIGAPPDMLGILGEAPWVHTINRGFLGPKRAAHHGQLAGPQ